MTLDKVSLISMDDPWKRGGVGGKTTHLRLLMKGLSEAGVASELLTARETASFRLRRGLAGVLIRRRMVDREGRYEHYMAQCSAQLRRYLAGSELDSQVVNPHDVPAARDVLAELGGRMRDMPMVLTLHGYYTMEASSSHELREGSPAFERFKAQEKGVYESSARIVCVDSRIRDYVLGMTDLPLDRLAVLPNAVDTGAFEPVSAERRAEARRSLGLRPSDTVVLCPRRLVVKNGVEFAVKAMAAMAKEHENMRLVLAGDGPERSNIEKLVRDLGLQTRVVMAGSVPHEDIHKFYSASDIVLIPSISSVGVQEATSLSMLEGMASSLPVVVTGIGGLKETIRNGDTGIIVNEADPRAIAEALNRLASDQEEAARLATNAREYVAKHHSYIEHTKRMLNEYEEALSQRRAA